MNLDQFSLLLLLVSALFFALSCVLYVLGLTKLNKAIASLKVKENKKRYIVASKEKMQELDRSLGLKTIKTKIADELYDKTILHVMQRQDVVEPAAVRFIIEYYEYSRWNCINDAEEPLYPNIGNNVWGHCGSTDDYLCVSLTDNNLWVIVDHDGNHIEMPSHLVVTHWKDFDEIVT